MSEEMENMSQNSAETQKQDREESREGYSRPSGYQRDYNNAGRSQRPRIHTQRAYSSEHGRSEGGFRPEGFGAGLQSGGEQGGYQPRQQGGYQPRQGYQPRPRYNGDKQEEGGYQPRQQGGYRPRYNNNQEGGYQPRQQGGYRPRYNSDGQEGGYQPRQQGGYRPRYNGDKQEEGGYQPRQQGGYRPRYNNNQEGGYQPRQQGGYQPRQQGGYGRQQGGYQPRQQGGYGRQQGGYGRQQGGYRPRYNNQEGGYGQRPGYDPNAKYSLKKRIEYKEEHVDPNEPIRLNKYLANAGVCSRREADEYIQKGEVTINGVVATELGMKVKRSDEVMFQGQPVTLEKKVYVLLNKPKDYVTTSDDPQQRKTVMDLVKDVCPERIYPVGRLDRNTTGVLLLTNDGDLASKLTHPKFLKKKVYHVYLDKNAAEEDLQKIAEGIELEDGEVHADSIEYADERDKSQVGIEIHSGRNRIVRRIFEKLGYRVVKLDRTQFAGLTKKNLRRGDWRFLTESEVEMLRNGMYE